MTHMDLKRIKTIGQAVAAGLLFFIPADAHRQAGPVPAAEDSHATVASISQPSNPAGTIQLCQALGPAAPCSPCAIDCYRSGNCGMATWDQMGIIDFQDYAQGEYVGHA